MNICAWKTGGWAKVIMDPELGTVRMHDPNDKGVGKRTFDFDQAGSLLGISMIWVKQVYDAETAQQAVFGDVAPLITSILDG